MTHITPIPSSSASANQQKYVYPEMDSRIPLQVQWKLDYLAPEYILDGPGSWGTGVDLYSRESVLQGTEIRITFNKCQFCIQWDVSCMRCTWAGNLLSATTDRYRPHEHIWSMIWFRAHGEVAGGGRKPERRSEVCSLALLYRNFCSSHVNP